ncbi:MAG: ATPase, T2SS/T4P/T4SS family [Granulosicoccaceae bacterium]
MEITRSPLGSSTCLTVHGPLDSDQAAATLRQQVEACMATWDVSLIIDLASVPLIYSQCLETLVEISQLLNRSGGSLTLINPSNTLRDVFKAVRMREHVSIVEEEQPEQQSASSLRFGEYLVQQQLVTPLQIENAIQRQRKSGEQLGEILIEQELIDDTAVLSYLSAQLNYPMVQLRTGLYDPSVIKAGLSPDNARRLKVLPLFRLHDRIFVATSNPQDLQPIDHVASTTGCDVSPVLARQQEIYEAAAAAYGDDMGLNSLIGSLDTGDDVEVIEQISDAYSAIDDTSDQSPVVNLVNSLLQRAVMEGVSDIHFEPERKVTRIRFRVDGMLYKVMSPPVDAHPALVSRLKIMANLDIAERRLPQDGRVQINTNGRNVDLRFSSLPGIFGEKIVLRILDKSRSVMDIEKLGMNAGALKEFKAQLRKSHGLILVTGPTGSGKTTTLYSALDALNSIEKSIVTIEDPVEYQVDDINQNQVRDKVGLSFAKLLKHVLRQDPDIIMVGEIRERETAEIAVQAALTGHLVLSTLHTNDAPSAITRLQDMGIEPYLLSSSLVGVMAQRLVRSICPSCRTEYVASPEVLATLGIETSDNVRLARGRGCSQCYDSGYRGRVAIHELISVNEDLQRLMANNPTRDQLAAYMENNNVDTLYNSGIARVLEGVTTPEEIMRITDN